jgi:hypothetical protein
MERKLMKLIQSSESKIFISSYYEFLGQIKYVISSDCRLLFQTLICPVLDSGNILGQLSSDIHLGLRFIGNLRLFSDTSLYTLLPKSSNHEFQTKYLTNSSH